MSKPKWKHAAPLQFFFEKMANETRADMNAAGCDEDLINDFYRDIFMSGAESVVQLLARGCDRASIKRELDAWRRSASAELGARARLQ